MDEIWMKEWEKEGQASSCFGLPELSAVRIPHWHSHAWEFDACRWRGNASVLASLTGSLWGGYQPLSLVREGEREGNSRGGFWAGVAMAMAIAAVSGTAAMAGTLRRSGVAPLRIKALVRSRGTVKLGVGTRASFAGAVKSEESGSTSGSLRDQAEASFSLSKDLAGPDFFLLDLAEKLENSVEQQGEGLGSRALAELRDRSAEKALNSRWPNSKDEAYRFTDVRFLRNLEISPTPTHSAPTPDFASGLGLDGTEAFRLVFVDGVISESLSKVDGLSEGAYVGSICNIPAEDAGGALSQALEHLGKPAAGTQDDLFTFLNGLGVQDAGVVFAPKGVHIPKPIHVVYYSTGRGGSENGEAGGTAISLASPRLLVVAETGARVEIIEQFVGAPEQTYWTNSVCEIHVAAGAEVSHSCSQEQDRNSVHIKQTHVSQGEKSTYKLVEAEIGGRLSRHNLQVIQLGPETHTEFSTFSLSSQRQVQDLHSRLVLNHPRGTSRQLHKCIVTHRSGQAVFDGNVKVNRLAQQTDAGQLSRSLLLAPGATVNVKPNLQIIADDVKCTHGAAISDLEEDQLFYFQARGIDALTARSALVFSFAADVFQSLGNDSLQKRLEGLVKSALASDGVVNPNVPVRQPIL